MWPLGVVVRRYMYIDFLILLSYPYSSCICSFLQHHPYFLFIFLEMYIKRILFNYNKTRRRIMPNRDFFTSRCVRKLRYIIAMLYTYLIGNQPKNTMVVFKMRDSVYT